MVVCNTGILPHDGTVVWFASHFTVSLMLNLVVVVAVFSSQWTYFIQTINKCNKLLVTKSYARAFSVRDHVGYLLA